MTSGGMAFDVKEIGVFMTYTRSADNQKLTGLVFSEEVALLGPLRFYKEDRNIN